MHTFPLRHRTPAPLPWDPHPLLPLCPSLAFLGVLLYGNVTLFLNLRQARGCI